MNLGMSLNAVQSAKSITLNKLGSKTQNTD